MYSCAISGKFFCNVYNIAIRVTYGYILRLLVIAIILRFSVINSDALAVTENYQEVVFIYKPAGNTDLSERTLEKLDINLYASIDDSFRVGVHRDDFNNDNQQDMLIRLKGSTQYGTRGCATYLFLAKGNTYITVQDFPVSHGILY